MSVEPKGLPATVESRGGGGIWTGAVAGGKGGCDPAQRDRGQPPDLRAGQARPSDRGVHCPPHPLPAQAGRGWKTLTQGGTFLFRSTPGHFHSGLTPRTPSQLATTMKNDYTEQITRTSLSGSRPPDVYTLFAPTSGWRRDSSQAEASTRSSVYGLPRPAKPPSRTARGFSTGLLTAPISAALRPEGDGAAVVYISRPPAEARGRPHARVDLDQFDLFRRNMF